MLQIAFRHSLRARIALLVAVLLAATSATLATILIRGQTAALTREMIRRGVSIADSVAAQASDPMLTGQVIPLAAAVDWARRNPGVRYAAVLDPLGIAKAHSLPDAVGSAFAEPPGLGASLPADDVGSTEGRAVRPGRLSGEAILDVTVAVVAPGGRAIGQVRLGLSQQAIRSETSRALWRTIPPILLLLAAGVALSAWLVVRSLAPVGALAAAADRLGGGDLSVRVPVAGQDEIASLAGSFNRAAEGLSEAQRLREREMRMHRDLQLAAEMQQMLVTPTAAAVPGIEVATFYRAALEVGGDYLDVLPAPEGTRRIGLVSADVSGKGVPASMAMAVTRSALRGLAFRDEPPDRTLLRLAETVSPDFPDSVFVTITLAWVDAVDRKIRFANAGHTAVGVVRANTGGVAWLQPKERCAAIGMAPAAVLAKRLVTVEWTLNPGDVVVLFTDGVNEAANPSKEYFGTERFEAALRDLRSKTCDEIARGIVVAVDAFANGAPQSDDIALVIARLSPEEGPAV